MSTWDYLSLWFWGYRINNITISKFSLIPTSRPTVINLRVWSHSYVFVPYIFYPDTNQDTQVIPYQFWSEPITCFQHMIIHSAMDTLLISKGDFLICNLNIRYYTLTVLKRNHDGINFSLTYYINHTTPALPNYHKVYPKKRIIHIIIHPQWNQLHHKSEQTYLPMSIYIFKSIPKSIQKTTSPL